MNHCIFVQLDELIYLRVTGADVDDFLQGQLSNDLRLLTAQQAQLSSYNSAKGRMLAVLHLIRDSDGILIELHRGVAAATLKRLRMFVLRSKVMFADTTSTLRSIGLIGNGAIDALAALGLPAPETPLASAVDSARGVTVLRRFGETPRFSLTGAADAIQVLETQLPAGSPFAHWQRADIEAGVPVVYPETSDHFVPQMANLDLLGGISFDKGCYTGQEIVARLHYLGQLKRRLYVCAADGLPPAAGSDVLGGQPVSTVGEIVDAVATETGSQVTAVLQMAHAHAAPLQLPDGRSLRIVTPPADA